MVKIIFHPKRYSFFELLYRSFLFFITALLQKNRKNMHKGMIFLFNIVATGCHFKDPIALRHNFSIALPIKLSSLYFNQQSMSIY